MGQGLLLAHYTREFAVYDYRAGQVLPTVEDLMRRNTYTNAMRALNRLLRLGVLPIVNENDTVATHPLRGQRLAGRAGGQRDQGGTR